MRRIKAILDTIGTVLVIVAAGALLWRLSQPAPSIPGAGGPPTEAVSDLSIPATDITRVRGDGSVALVEFSDFECPFCAEFTRTTAPLIETQLLESGQIRHVFFNFPLNIHPRAQKASEAAECAGKQGRFWEMHASLFENPRELRVGSRLIAHSSSRRRA